MNLYVQQSPSTLLAFQDVLVLNPKLKDQVGDNFVMIINDIGTNLILPAAFDSHVPQDNVGLSNRQRKYLEVELRDKVDVHLNFSMITIIPVIQQVDLFISCYFYGGEHRSYEEKVPEILRQFNERFSGHVFNKEHHIPIKIHGKLYEVHILSLSDGSLEKNYGVMGKECQIHCETESFMEF